MYGCGINGKELQAVRCLHQLRLPVADPGVVDDGIETAELVDLFSDGRRIRNARQVADDDVFRADDLLAGLVCARGAAGVQYDVVALLDQKLGGHPSEAVGGAGYESACPYILLAWPFGNWSRWRSGSTSSAARTKKPEPGSCVSTVRKSIRLAIGGENEPRAV
jgi:hypothetical protein